MSSLATLSYFVDGVSIVLRQELVDSLGVVRVDSIKLDEVVRLDDTIGELFIKGSISLGNLRE